MPIISDGKGGFMTSNEAGEWVPATMIVNPENGLKMLNDGGEWKVAPGTGPSALGSAARGLVRGATFGFNDEIGGAASGIKGLLTGEGYLPAYEKSRDASRREDKADAFVNPWSDIAGQATGGVASALLTRGASARAGLTAKAVTPLVKALTGWMSPGAARMATGSAAGAAGGALSGFGSGEGEDDRLSGAGVGAGLGGALGAAIPAALSGAQVVKQRLATALNLGGGETRANDLIARAAARDNLTMDDLGVFSSAARNNPLALVDLGKRGMVSLGAVAANTPSRAMTVADDFVQARRGSRPDRVGLMGDTAFGGGGGTDVMDTMAELSAIRQLNASPLYKSAFSKPAGFTDAMGTVLDDPITRAGLKRGLEIQRIENTTRAAKGGERVPTTDPAIKFGDDDVPRIVGVPNMRSLDAVKRGLDAIIDDARDSQTGKVAWTERLRAIDGLRRQWVDMLDQRNPDYKAARAAWAGPSSQMDALSAGRTAFRTDRDTVANRMRDTVAPDVRDAYRLGAGRNFSDMTSDPATVSGKIRDLVEDRTMQARLASILDDETRNQFERGLRREHEMSAVEAAVNPRANSHTARLIAAGEDMKTETGPLAAAFGQFASGHPAIAAKTAIADLWRRGVGGINSKTSDALADALFSTDPYKRSATIERVRAQMIARALQAQLTAGREVAVSGGLGSVVGNQ